MELRYPNLSSGYIGLYGDKQTLSSKFYSTFKMDLSNHLTDLENEIIIFPQRVPRSGFFDELYQLETNYYKETFVSKKNHLKESIRKVANEMSVNPNGKQSRLYINLGNVCLRYGCFDEIITLSPKLYQDTDFALEVYFLKISARIEHHLSNDITVDSNCYLELASEFLPRKEVTEREKIMLLNNMIVTYYRHQTTRDDNKTIFNYAKLLEALLERFENNQPLNQLYCSIGYRGLAMVTEFGFDKQAELLNRAEMLANNMHGDSPSEAIVAVENRYTCYQSIAKWHENNGDFEQAEEYLLKMIPIDPYDSTGYNALAFFYLHREEYSSASNYFKRAMELGPPGAGMNAYYYAKCLEKIGKEEEAASYLHMASELDSQGISPWLDLIDYYLSHRMPDRARSIAKHVFNTATLSDQLEYDETIRLQNIIG